LYTVQVNGEVIGTSVSKGEWYRASLARGKQSTDEVACSRDPLLRACGFTKWFNIDGPRPISRHFEINNTIIITDNRAAALVTSDLVHK